MGQKSQCLIGKETIQEKIIDKTFEIGANTFFQVNPQSAENIFKYVKSIIKNENVKPTVLDDERFVDDIYTNFENFPLNN